MAALVSSDEGAKGLWRAYSPPADRRLCVVGGVGAGEGYASFVVIYIDGRERARDEDAVFHGSIDALTHTLTPTAVVRGDIAYGDPQRWAVTSELIAFAWHPGGFIYVVEADGSQYALIDDPVVGSAQHPSAVGRDVYWHDWSAAVRLAHGRRGVAPSFFLDIAPDDIWDHATDGRERVWVEARGRTSTRYDSVTLMTSPYSTDPTALSPRPVASLEAPYPSAYGGGWYAMIRADPRRLEVIRTADGTRRAWSPPADQELVFRAPIYASDHDVMVQTRREEREYLFRVNPHTLPRVE